MMTGLPMRLLAILGMAVGGIAVASAQFTTTVNIPSDRLGQYFDSNTQLNLYDDGTLPFQYEIGRATKFMTVDGELVIEPGTTNVEVNIYGGSTDPLTPLVVNGEAVVNISGGLVHELRATSGTVHMTGGFVTKSIHAQALSIHGGIVGQVDAGFRGTADLTGGLIGGLRADAATIAGGDFRLNGEVIAGLESSGNVVEIDLPAESVLSGTLSDGMPFLISDGSIGSLTLRATTLADGPAEVFASTDGLPVGIRPGQTLHVRNGSQLPSYYRSSWDNVINVESGGSVGDYLSVAGSELNIRGGTVGSGLRVHRGGTLNLFDGQIGQSLNAFAGSTVHISGGTVDQRFNANQGSNILISGGLVEQMTAKSGSVIDFRGGVLGRLYMNRNSKVTIVGGEFRSDGQLLSGLETVGSQREWTLPAETWLTGTLADGTPFAFSDGTFQLESAELPPIGPSLIVASEGNIPLGIRQGQTLHVDDAVGRRFRAGAGSVVNVEPSGSVGDRFSAAGAEVNVSGGSIGEWFDAAPGSVVNVEAGGRVGDFFTANGAEVDISGGAVGYFNARNGTTVNVSGGHVADLNIHTRSSLHMTGGTGHLSAGQSTEANISGGSVSVIAWEASRVSISGGGIGDLYVRDGANVALSGGDFRLDGEPIDAVANELVAISWPANSRLSGVFSDGTPFVFENRRSVTLSLEPVTVADIGAPTFTASIDTVPFGIRQGQTLVVDAAVNSNFVASDGSSVDVQSGGRVGDNLRLLDAELLVSDGSIGDNLRAYGSSAVTMSGGTIGSTRLMDESQAKLSGGVFGSLSAESGTSVVISGGEFLLDGEPIDGLATGEVDPFSLDIPSGSILSGVLGDGTPFVIIPSRDTSFAPGVLKLVNTELAPIVTAEIRASSEQVPLGIRTGQTVIVEDGASLSHNLILGRGSKVRVESGGAAKQGLTSISGDMELLGEVGEVRAYLGSTASVSGGTVARVSAKKESRVQVSGGSVSFIEADSSYVDLVGGSAEWISASNSAVNISGGELGWFAATDSSVTLSGGTQDAMHFQVWESQGESELHILGQEFYLDGLPIDGVANLGDSMLLDVERKHQALTGILMDGNVFRIELHSRAADGCTSYGCSDFIDHDVTIRLTNAVPEPAGRCLGLLALLLLTIVRVKAYA